jgi:RNA polymerase sigma factor (TIGR02999 family)
MINLTLLLRKALGGDKAAEQEAISLVYPELKRIAARLSAQESSDPALSPTILVSDFYAEKFRSTAGLPGGITDRNHFFCIAARAMRQVLVDRARARNATKRQPVDPNFTQRPCTALAPETLLALEAALRRLEGLAAQAAKVIELRYYLGCTVEETAKSLGISTKQVRAEWDFARQWLESELS